MRYVTPKKYLGQHFLKDENIARQIVEGLKPASEEVEVIEIGPGTGVLTKFLLPKYAHFRAFDVDSESITYLKEAYPNHAAKFLEEDFLRFNITTFSQPVSIIGNFPYNISSQLFFAFWESRNYVGEIVCMLQKEVADRIASKEGNKTYGILSVLLGAFYDIEYLFTVPPNVFNPPPKVNSAVIRLVRNNVDSLDCDEKMFKKVVKAGFGKRRKTLRNALKDLNLEFDNTLPVFDKRAEQLSVSDFIALTKYVSP